MQIICPKFARCLITMLGESNETRNEFKNFNVTCPINAKDCGVNFGQFGNEATVYAKGKTDLNVNCSNTGCRRINIESTTSGAANVLCYRNACQGYFILFYLFYFYFCFLFWCFFFYLFLYFCFLFFWTEWTLTYKMQMVLTLYATDSLITKQVAPMKV